MPDKRILIAGAALVALVVVFFAFRKRANAASMAYAPPPGPPTPQAAITTLMATPPASLAQSVAQTALNKYVLPAVGQGVNAILPQSTATGPLPTCPPGYVGAHPDRPSLWCGGERETPCPPEGGGWACAAMRALKGSAR